MTYAYRCTCGHEWEITASPADRFDQPCPKCGKTADRPVIKPVRSVWKCAK